MAAKAPFSVPVIDPTEKSEGPVYRSVINPYSLVDSPIPTKIRTLYDLLHHVADTHEDKDMFGTRQVEKIIEEEKEIERQGKKVVKKWKYQQLSGYNWLTARQAQQRARHFGVGLRNQLGVNAGDRVIIFNSTSADWILFAHGCFTQSITIATVYDTLGEDGLVHALIETECSTIFTNKDLLQVVANIRERVPHLRHVIYNGDSDKKVVEIPGVQVTSLDQLEETGKAKVDDVPPVPPKSDDLACIMFTSGSTGKPKGVLLSHSNLIAAVGGIDQLLGYHVTKEDVILVYLPLAHVLEFILEHISMYWGVQLGFGTPRTLTDTSVRNCKGDLRELRPTVMAGVPAVWDTIRKGVLTKLNKASPLARRVFDTAFSLKWSLIQSGMPTGFLDPVFAQIREQTGGRLRFALSGGAPISAASQQFLSVTLCPILQGYGMTESCGMCSILAPEMFQLKATGAPVPCVEIKLVDVPEAGYFAQDEKLPRGEIWVRGPAVTKGYYKNPGATSETITVDGWLQTGDIGQWQPDGTLIIIDRKKNLVKLSNGEYIALEKLESIYKTAHIVGNICVYADSLRSRAVALVFAPENEVLRIGKELGLSEGYHDLVLDRKVRDQALKEIHEDGKRNKLTGAELVGDVFLCDEEWTAQNGLLTAAQKIKRQDIYKKFENEINDMYQRIE